MRAHNVRLDLDTPELAADYDRVGVRQLAHGKLLIEMLLPQPGEQVLDVGSGTGLLGAWVADRILPGGRVVGIDPLPLRVEHARAKGCANFEPHVGSAEDLGGFTAASFDVAYMNSVLHWIGDKPRALAEIFRVLKASGRLGLTTPNAERIHQPALLVREATVAAGLAPDRQAGEAHPGTVNATQLEDLLAGAGFVDVLCVQRVIVDDVPDARTLLQWSRSSSFGNALPQLTAEEEARVLTALASSLERHRTADGFRVERYMLFATARKPSREA